jgi:hypothetical protein
MEATMQVRLAEALLRRKELQEKVDQLRSIKDKDLFEVRARRQNVTENVDDVVAQVPLLSSAEVTHAFDWHAKRLRMIDALIQQANWTTEISVDETVMTDYEAPALKRDSSSAKLSQ